MSNVPANQVIRDRLSRIGKTVVDVAREMDVNVSIVRGVLDGRLKGTRGDAHKVAVGLGIKEGVVVADNMSIVDAMKASAN